MSNTSIKTIAESLGVSVMTVSLVLNNKADGRVSQVLIDKIKQVAKELNYRPNNIARSLRSGKSYVIGLVVADISNPFFAKMAFYIQQEAEKNHYNVIVVNTNESTERFQQVISTLVVQRVDGLIIVPTHHCEQHLLRLQQNGIPFVLLDRCFEQVKSTNVMSDNYEASLKAMSCLIAQGYKRIALITYTDPMIHLQLRQQAYEDILTDAGVYDPQLVRKVSVYAVSEDMGLVINELMNSDDSLDALYFMTNTLSLEGIRCMCKQHDLAKNRVKIVSFDNHDVFDFINMDIAYVQQPLQQMSEAVVHEILSIINTNEDNKKQIVLPSVFYC